MKRALNRKKANKNNFLKTTFIKHLFTKIKPLTFKYLILFEKIKR